MRRRKNPHEVARSFAGALQALYSPGNDQGPEDAAKQLRTALEEGKKRFEELRLEREQIAIEEKRVAALELRRVKWQIGIGTGLITAAAAVTGYVAYASGANGAIMVLAMHGAAALVKDLYYGMFKYLDMRARRAKEIV